MNRTAERVRELEQVARQVRLDAIEMAFSAGERGGHLGGGLSSVEILTALYGEVLRYDVKNPYWANRDRFIASKNHCVLALFPVLANAGFLNRSELFEFSKDGGRLAGYPRKVEIGLEYSGGSLGMAISVGVGLALAAREDKRDTQIYILMGDGEMAEGSIWEAMMSAAHYGLSNLTAIIDRNHLCYDGDTEEIMALEDLGAKFESFNWHVSKCDGHDIGDLLRAFSEPSVGKPHVVIADTVKGKGVSFIENRREWHHSRLSKAQYETAIQELQGGVQ